MGNTLDGIGGYALCLRGGGGGKSVSNVHSFAQRTLANDGRDGET